MSQITEPALSPVLQTLLLLSGNTVAVTAEMWASVLCWCSMRATIPFEVSDRWSLSLLKSLFLPLYSLFWSTKVFFFFCLVFFSYLGCLWCNWVQCDWCKLAICLQKRLFLQVKIKQKRYKIAAANPAVSKKQCVLMLKLCGHNDIICIIQLWVLTSYSVLTEVTTKC